MSGQPDPKEKLPIQRFFPFARSLYGEDLLEDFLVSAVSAVLLIRLYLSLTGYPQLGGGGLHVAHMLWGGLLMLVAIILSLGFISRPAHEWAAVLGGFGFGAFIDELGKFLTSDNNYFFQPAIAIIYVLFVLLYLVIQAVFNRSPLTRPERLANAFELMQQGSLNGLSGEEEKAMLRMLEHSDQGDPLVNHLREMLLHIRVVPSRRPHLIDRFKTRLDVLYQTVINRWWFAAAVVAFFTFTAVTGFSAALGAIERTWSVVLAISALAIVLLGLLQAWKGRQPNLQIPLAGGIILIALLVIWVTVANRQKFDFPFADWSLFVCSSLSALLIVTGIVLMGWSRLSAYQMFHRAILVSLLLTSVFAFYSYQFFALIGVFLNTLILFVLRFMINREKTSS